MGISNKEIKNFLEESKKVWKVMRKPSKDELTLTLKVTLLLIVLIGLVGFAISEVIYYIFNVLYLG